MWAGVRNHPTRLNHAYCINRRLARSSVALLWFEFSLPGCNTLWTNKQLKISDSIGQAHFAYGFMKKPAMDMRMALELLLNRQGIENLECWTMALNLMEPLAKPAIGKSFPSLLSLKFWSLSRQDMLFCIAKPFFRPKALPVYRLYYK